MDRDGESNELFGKVPTDAKQKSQRMVDVKMVIYSWLMMVYIYPLVNDVKKCELVLPTW